MIPVLFPLLTCVVISALVQLWSDSQRLWRESILIGITLCSGWLVLGTELLSLLHAISFWPVLLWWAAPLIALSVALAMKVRGRTWRISWPPLRVFDWLLIVCTAAILGVSWCQAWVSPPNNVDSQEYHLQRQVFWLQQHSVENYPTNNARQLAMPPGTEFAGLTLLALSGNDRYHNLVQWLAFVVSLLAVSLTTRRYDPRPTPQLLSALWVVTIPLAFLQASTTKNDVVVMMWMCMLIYWVLQLAATGPIRWAHVALIGLGFGLLMLTKGTGVIFGLPLGLVAAGILVAAHRRAAAPALALIGAVALLVNAGAFARNYATFGSIAPDQPGIHDGPPVGNEDFSPLALLSNVLRNLGSHLVTPSQAWNDRMAQAVVDLHTQFGRDLNDPRSTWMPGGRFRPYQFWQDDEDKAAAPAHLLLVLLMPLAMLWARRQIPWRPSLLLWFVFLAGFFLFSALLKWQNWNVRLVIALPAVLAPVFAWTLAAPRLRYLTWPPIVLLVATVAASFNSFQRPLWGPKNIFEADPLALRCYYHPEWPQQYRELVQRVESFSPKIVGFATWAGSPDYPVQRLLLDSASPPTFTAFNAKFSAGKTEPDPDVLLVSRQNPRRLQHEATGTWYVSQGRVGRFTLLTKE